MVLYLLSSILYLLTSLFSRSFHFSHDFGGINLLHSSSVYCGQASSVCFSSNSWECVNWVNCNQGVLQIQWWTDRSSPWPQGAYSAMIITSNWTWSFKGSRTVGRTTFLWMGCRQSKQWNQSLIHFVCRYFFCPCFVSATTVTIFVLLVWWHFYAGYYTHTLCKLVSVWCPDQQQEQHLRIY